MKPKTTCISLGFADNCKGCINRKSCKRNVTTPGGASAMVPPAGMMHQEAPPGTIRVYDTAENAQDLFVSSLYCSFHIIPKVFWERVYTVSHVWG
jgi:hypothetical protein